MLDLTGVWFNTDDENSEVIVIRQVLITLTVFCLGNRNGMNYENFGYGRLEDENQSEGSEFIITWAYTHASHGGKKGVVHKTTIRIESEDLLLHVNDELLTRGTKAKPDIRYGNWVRGPKVKTDSRGLFCFV